MSTETLIPPKSAKTKAVTSSNVAAHKALVETGSKQTPAATPTVSPEMRLSMIAEAAYFRALRRNFAAGSEVDDWLLGEQDVIQQLGLQAQV